MDYNIIVGVNQMCDQGHGDVFKSENCLVKELEIGKTIIKGTKTLKNVYILEGINEQCFLSKIKESWLWHKTLGHLSFS